VFSQPTPTVKDTDLSVPLFQQAKVGAYVMKQKMLGNKHYPLVLMLEPLFQCNLACAGCGKIDYPKPISSHRQNTSSSPFTWTV